MADLYDALLRHGNQLGANLRDDDGDDDDDLGDGRGGSNDGGDNNESRAGDDDYFDLKPVVANVDLRPGGGGGGGGGGGRRNAGGDEHAAAMLEEDKEPLQFCIVGKPNVGKSTLLNRLVCDERVRSLTAEQYDEKKKMLTMVVVVVEEMEEEAGRELRKGVPFCLLACRVYLRVSACVPEQVITSAEPGTTRDAVCVQWEYDGRLVNIVDTAGIQKGSSGLRLQVCPQPRLLQSHPARCRCRCRCFASPRLACDSSSPSPSLSSWSSSSSSSFSSPSSPPPSSSSSSSSSSSLWCA
jgi:hypothetical protein